jgi:hypothetical protein
VFRIYHFGVGSGNDSATKAIDKPVDLPGQIDEDEGDIASDANVQNSSSYFEVQPPSLPAELI